MLSRCATADSAGSPAGLIVGGHVALIAWQAVMVESWQHERRPVCRPDPVGPANPGGLLACC